MTTPGGRVIVSVVASAIVTIVLGACAGGRAHAGSNGPTAMTAPSATIYFDNDGREYAHVYVVSDRRQWYLGRVEAGARRSLRVPDEAIVTSSQRLQLAVMIGHQLLRRGSWCQRQSSVRGAAACVRDRPSDQVASAPPVT
jgi:hypothetical protein